MPVHKHESSSAATADQATTAAEFSGSLSSSSSSSSSSCTSTTASPTASRLPSMRLVTSGVAAAATTTTHNRRLHSPPTIGSGKSLSWPTIVVNCSARFAMWSLFAYVCCLSVVDVQRGKELFSWHPPLLTLAFCLASESILCFSDANLATHRLAHATRVRLHWLLQAAAAAAALVGFAAVCVHKVRNDKRHFGTWHAQYGLAAMLLAALTGAAGVAANYAVALRHRWRPQSLKIAHAAAALMQYKLAAVATLLGVFSSWFGKHGTTAGAAGCCVAVATVAVYVGAKPTRTLWARARSAWMRAYDL